MSTATTNERERIGGNNPPETSIAEHLAEQYQDLEDEVLALAVSANKVKNIDIQTDEDALKVASVVKAAQLVDAKVEVARTREKAPHLARGKEVDAFFHAWSHTSRDPAEMGRVTRIMAALNKKLRTYQETKNAATRARREAEDKRQREIEEAARRRAEEGRAAGKPDEVAEAANDAFAELAAMRDRALARKRAQEAQVRAPEGDLLLSSSEHWVFDVEDLRKVDLNSLRDHLPEAAIHSAIRAFVAKGGRSLDGVRIYQETRSIVR